MEIEAIKKEHMETTLDIENQKKRQGAVDTSFTNRIIVVNSCRLNEYIFIHELLLLKDFFFIPI